MHNKRLARSGMTLVEVIICLAITGLLLAAVSTHLIESASLGLKTSSTLEHSRSARELIDRLSRDIRDSQIMELHVSYADRSDIRRDGELGNYLVLHSVDDAGVIVGTIGYYAVTADGGDGWILYRHDSENGDSAAGSLPEVGAVGSHRIVTRAVQLPTSDNLFTCVRDRGVSLQGEFGTAGQGKRGRSEFIRCTISTRS